MARETLANQNKHLEQIQSFVDLGRNPTIDLLQARVDQANAEVQLINAQNDYATARALLNQAMGVEADIGYDVEPTSERAGARRVVVARRAGRRGAERAGPRSRRCASNCARRC